jgi:hypothetical protein
MHGFARDNQGADIPDREPLALGSPALRHVIRENFGIMTRKQIIGSLNDSETDHRVS